MTGKEFMEWIRENGAEELELVILDSAENAWEVKPTIENGEDIDAYQNGFIEEGRRYVVL